jgi:hypothetical protein
MIVLEKKFMEQVPGALLRIAKALEGINEKLDVLTQRTDMTRWEQQESEPETAPEDDVDYNELEEAVNGLSYSNWTAKRALQKALYYRPQYVVKIAATSLSFYYSGVISKQVAEAVENGEIQVIAPEMKDVQVSKWKDGQYVKGTRRQPVGKYQINLKSAVLWLESHGHRQVPAGNPVYKCIEKIIKS